MTDAFLSDERPNTKNKAQCIKNVMVEESSPEVTSSCGRLTSSDFREVDLELWELDVNQQRNQIHQPRSAIPVPTMKSYSETSSLSGRDDLSPPGSINGYSVDSSDAKKKKGPTPRQQEELCLVCGDRASGYHYNALTCEGCKGFFRRSITKNAVYQCKYGDSCEIDMYMRRKCQECRLKKCLSVGMRPECVVPEIQCEVKRREKKAQREKGKPTSTTNGSPDLILADTPVIKVRKSKKLRKTEPNTTQSHNEKTSTNGVKPISPEQEELIHRLVYFQNEYEQPSDEDLKRISNTPSEGEDQSDLNFRHITEITILTVQLIVEFAKRLPGFDKLLREDQIALLKACSSEVSGHFPDGSSAHFCSPVGFLGLI
ncbi:hypothetical protein RUM44_002829 [Polyplax serrata]|uniref:Ecdysone receptor n=1 Tax=Polyplax serrata TaxID=468196 RepID=A0ABR1AFT6_POLSC